MLEVEELRSLDMTVMVENPLLILVSFLFLHLKTLLSSLLKSTVNILSFRTLSHTRTILSQHWHNINGFDTQIKLFVDRSCHSELSLHRMVTSR